MTRQEHSIFFQNKKADIYRDKEQDKNSKKFKINQFKSIALVTD